MDLSYCQFYSQSLDQRSRLSEVEFPNVIHLTHKRRTTQYTLDVGGKKEVTPGKEDCHHLTFLVKNILESNQTFHCQQFKRKRMGILLLEKEYLWSQSLSWRQQPSRIL